MGILSQWPALTLENATSALKSAGAIGAKGANSGTSTTDPSLTNASRSYLVTITQNQDVPKGDPVVVVGQISQDFTMSHSAQWATPWGAGLMSDGTLGNIAAVTSGTRLVAQVATLQVWQGSGNDMRFSISFELRAWSSAERDVMAPLRALMKMAMPSMDSSGFLISPGPILPPEAIKELTPVVTKAVAGAATAAFKGAVDTFSAAMSDGGSKALAVSQQAVSDVKKNIGAIAKRAAVDSKMQNKINIRIGHWFSLSNIVVNQVTHVMKSQQPGPNGGLMAADVTIEFSPMFALTAEDLPFILPKGGYGEGGALADPVFLR